MALKTAAATRAPRGTKSLTQAFFAAANDVPEAQRDAVVKSALAAIRDELKEARDKAKIAKAKAKAKSGKTVKAAPGARNGAKAPKPSPAAAPKAGKATAKPGRKASSKPARETVPDPDAG